MNNRTTIVIAGAGPAGLSAALTIARHGRHAIIHEQAGDVGHRFHGDFQGIENWTTEGDVLDELSSIGIESSFKAFPYHEVVIYDPHGLEFICRSPQPLFYLVRRGTGSGSLDITLKQLALNNGVEIHFNSKCSTLPSGGIVAQGPHRADVIAVGYLFDTPNANGAYLALSDSLAPQGYAYLLIHDGQGTLASCMFNNFHREREYLQRTVEFFTKHVGVVMKNQRHFGGIGNFSIPASTSKNGILYTGESAGFQDALAGFGLRYAMLSGHYAAESLCRNLPHSYDQQWKKRFLGLMRAAVINRYLYTMFSNFGYGQFVKGLIRSQDARYWLRKHYNPELWKSVLYPSARRAFDKRLNGLYPEPDCQCTWCRCHHEP